MDNPLKGELVKSSTMNRKTVVMLLIALVIAASGVALASYAEADDSPGGVVIGWVLLVSSGALGTRAFLRRES